MENLPIEILAQIFGYFDEEDFLIFQTLSRRFKVAVTRHRIYLKPRTISVSLGGKKMIKHYLGLRIGSISYVFIVRNGRIMNLRKNQERFFKAFSSPPPRFFGIFSSSDRSQKMSTFLMKLSTFAHIDELHVKTSWDDKHFSKFLSTMQKISKYFRKDSKQEILEFHDDSHSMLTNEGWERFQNLAKIRNIAVMVDNFDNLLKHLHRIVEKGFSYKLHTPFNIFFNTEKFFDLDLTDVLDQFNSELIGSLTTERMNDGFHIVDTNTKVKLHFVTKESDTHKYILFVVHPRCLCSIAAP